MGVLPLRLAKGWRASAQDDRRSNGWRRITYETLFTPTILNPIIGDLRHRVLLGIVGVIACYRQLLLAELQKTPVAYDKASAVRRLLHAAVISLILLSMATAQKSTEIAASHKVREQVTWHPPDFPVTDNGQSWTKPKPMVTSLLADGLSIQLEKTDIQAISKRYRTALGQEGDAGEFFEWLCFVGGRQGQRWAMWLGSGEIDGGRVSDFLVKQITSDAEVDWRCGVLPATVAELTTSPDKLRLGRL